MRIILALLLIVGLTLAIPWSGAPIGNNENNIQYTWDGMTFEVQELNIGFVSVTESVDGADSVGVWFDVPTATYDFWDVYVMASITGDATDEDMTAKLNWYDNGAYTSRTLADTLKWVGFSSADTNFGTVWYTMTTSGGTAATVASLVPGVPYVCPIQFRCEDTASATDSTGYIFEVVTTDSCEVNIQLIVIPRT